MTQRTFHFSPFTLTEDKTSYNDFVLNHSGVEVSGIGVSVACGDSKIGSVGLG